MSEAYELLVNTTYTLTGVLHGGTSPLKPFEDETR